MHKTSAQAFTVDYVFDKETPGTYRYVAVVGKDERLPVGSNVIYVAKNLDLQATKIRATFEVVERDVRMGDVLRD